MTPNQILERVQREADARFGETIDLLFGVLRNRHTHNSWRRECRCEYCRFITDLYTTERLRLHQIKKRINHYEYLWNLTESEMHVMLSLEMRRNDQVKRLFALKDHKNELKENIL